MNQSVKENTLNIINNDSFVSKSIIYDLPKKYYDKTYNNFKAYSDDLKIKLNTCLEFARGITEKKSIVFTGSVGNGKTHLAVMIAKNMTEINSKHGLRKQTVRFCVADELFTTFNDLTFQKKSKMEFVDELLRNDLLIIDDLGIANFTPAKQENLYLLVNKAYLEMKNILVTTNFTLEQLAKIDERIVSRLIEMAIILKFGLKDYRTIKQ